MRLPFGRAEFHAGKNTSSSYNGLTENLMPQQMPTFRERAPWWGGDLQTLRNVLIGATEPTYHAIARRLTLPMTDGSGDVLSAFLEQPNASRPGHNPLIVLIHGLGGSEDSTYMQRTAAHWLERNHSVVRINLRGAGPSGQSCRLRYHAGRTQDLADALRALQDIDATDSSEGIVLIGYSLGGNMLLKFLSEFSQTPNLLAAASVSSPIDLAASSRRLHESRNLLYQRFLLRGLVKESLGGKADISQRDRQAILSARSIYEFDETFVAPCNGFDGANDYYAQCSASQFLAGIRTPTLLVHALNDPWIPARAYTQFPWEENPHLHPCLLEGGGHVGFHSQGLSTPWHDHAIEAFVKECKEQAVIRSQHD